MKKNERAFLVNAMWVPLFVGIMTAALSKNPSVNPYIIAVLMGVLVWLCVTWTIRCL